MKPKKSLGQNFLKDKAVLNKIIKAASLKVDDFVVEVGPGQGVLTEELVKNVEKVLAIEVDRGLASKLKEKFRNSINLEVINEDILRVNLPEIIKSNWELVNSNLEKEKTPNYQLPITNYKVIANIPYYITSPIIQLFLETKYPPVEMILMVQKEVAERICAGPGEMSILAVAVQYYAEAELLFNVPRSAFWPIPEVDSAVIKITYLPSPALSTGRPLPKGEVERERKKFFRIVRAGFSARRKKLVNNLSSSLQVDKNVVEETLKKVELDPKIRAQELSVEDWKKLAQLID